MRIGIDLDNTIICYDGVFRSAALDMGLLAESVPAHKQAVKDWVQARHGNDEWTKLQAEVYGPRLAEAAPYAGALDFIRQHREAGDTLCIVSHKTQFPALGVQIDLRVAALAWLEANDFIGDRALTAYDVEFHATRPEKVRAIARRGCEVFIDDLPEVFAEPEFPSSAKRILFDPDDSHRALGDLDRARSWAEVSEKLPVTGKGGRP